MQTDFKTSSGTKPRARNLQREEEPDSCRTVEELLALIEEERLQEEREKQAENQPMQIENLLKARNEINTLMEMQAERQPLQHENQIKAGSEINALTEMQAELQPLQH